MTVIVAQAHIGQQSNDIPFGHCKAPVDPSVPRAVFNANPLDLVAAAVALPPSLPSSSPSEYRLASKRKTPDDDRDRDDDDDDENTVRPKRLRADGDSLFGPLSSTPTPPPPPIVATSTDVLNYALEQAIVAILTPQPQEPTPPPTPQPAHAALPPTNPAGPSRTTSPLSSPSLLPPFEEAEAPTPIIERSYNPLPPRPVEPPLWKAACRTRVDAILDTYGAAAVRATVAQEASRRYERWRLGVPDRRSATEAPLPSKSGSDLRVEIYTPQYFSSSTTDMETDEKTESELEDDVDMSFDFDDDSESEEDEAGEDSEDAEDEYDDASPHESVFDVSVADPPRSAPEPPVPLPAAIAVPALPSVAPPPLPRLSSIPVYCLRTYPDSQRLGTPARVASWARGVLERGQLTMQAHLSRMTGLPRMMEW